MMDGTNWTLQLKHQDQSIESGGSNNYPDLFEVDSENEEYFDLFLAAVSDLIGGKSFT
ncbi:MAG: hypothetical protein VCF25_24135 [Candidatus Poribacteria bacterium]|jgi:hypothetical protein